PMLRTTDPSSPTSSLLRKSARAFLVLALVLTSPTLLAAWDFNMPVGVTEISRQTYGLHMTIFWICVVIGALVYAVLIYSMFAYRKSKGAVAAKFHHNTLVEIIWTGIPFIILIAMAVPATRVLS